MDFRRSDASRLLLRAAVLPAVSGWHDLRQSFHLRSDASRLLLRAPVLPAASGRHDLRLR
jgi:hypothetical protein